MRTVPLILLSLLGCTVQITKTETAQEAPNQLATGTHREAVRASELNGIGLVVGLNGTGSKKGTPATLELIENAIQQKIEGASEFTPQNASVVLIKANLPEDSIDGLPLALEIRTFDDATDISGGTLLPTQLTGCNGEIYAEANCAIPVLSRRTEGVIDGGEIVKLPN